MGGLEESCLLYSGHWITSLMKIGALRDADLQSVILLLQSRLARAKMPSTAKSFMLPLAMTVLQHGPSTFRYMLQAH
jgi:hypothetical protein